MTEPTVGIIPEGGIIVEKGAGGQGGPAPTVLSDAHHERGDIKLMGRAVKERWDVPAEYRVELVNRLMEVVRKREVSVATRTGEVVPVDGPADVSAVAAAKVIVAMEGQNQEDDHLAEKTKRLDEGKPTENIGFKAFVGIDPDKV